MSLEIETTVDALLASYGVAYSALYMGVKKNALDGKHEMDRWSIAFTKGDGREAFEEFAFYTGLGLRAPATAKDKQEAAWGYQGLTEKDKQGLTPYGRRYLADVEKKRKPESPRSASVLHSLLLDAEASVTSFRNWCDEFGYDNDSISARNTYDACQENADKLKRIFNLEQLDQLAEALQDY